MRRLRLFAYPLRLNMPNAYWDLLYGEIRSQTGCEMFNNTFGRLLFSFHGMQVVHIHWPQIIYASRFGWLRPFKFLCVIFVLIISRLRGDILVWTVHNYSDHDRPGSRLESLTMNFLVRWSSSIIVHTEAGRYFIEHTYGRTKNVYIIPHGSSIDFYGPVRSARDPELAQRFGVADTDTVFLQLGSIRPYKGHEQAIELFNRMSQSQKLIIVGKSNNSSYLSHLQTLISGKNIYIVSEKIPHEDISRWFSIAHWALFTFRAILSSGSVILAQSYRVPVIVPAIGDMPYVVEDRHSGLVYTASEEGLAEAVKVAMSMQPDEREILAKQPYLNLHKINYPSLAKATLTAYMYESGRL